VSLAPPDDHGLCASCHERLVGRYCHQCGERIVDPQDFTVRHFAEQALEAVTQLDGKLWRTFRTLLRRPGMLTAQYLRGRRSMYMKPFTVFLLVNVVFLLATRTHALTKPFSSNLSQVFAPSVEQLHERVLPGSDLRQFAQAVEVYQRGRPAPDRAVTRPSRQRAPRRMHPSRAITSPRRASRRESPSWQARARGSRAQRTQRAHELLERVGDLPHVAAVVPQDARVRVVGALVVEHEPHLAAMFAGEREQERTADVIMPDEKEIGAGQRRALAVRARREIA
jgi:hypothetical protein